MPTVLFSFEDADQRDLFLKHLKDSATFMAASDASQASDGYEQRLRMSSLIDSVLDSVRLDPPIRPDDERYAALYVGSHKLCEGKYTDMIAKFDAECASHNAALELRELRSGTWQVIRKRKVQQVQPQQLGF